MTLQSQNGNHQLPNLEQIEFPLIKAFPESVIQSINSDTEKDAIKVRDIRGGHKAKYVAGEDFIKRLNEVFGFLWSFEVVETKLEQTHVVVLGKLTVHIPGQTITLSDGTKIQRESISLVKFQYGGSDTKKYGSDGSGYKRGDIIDLADDFKSATTDALKKCATLFGLFSDVYSGGVASEASATQVQALILKWEKTGKSLEELDAWVKATLNKKKESLSQLEVMQLIPKVMDMIPKEVSKK